MSIFALTCGDANTVFDVVARHDSADSYSRPNPYHNSKRYFGPTARTPVMGIPATDDLEFFGDSDAAQLFEQAVEKVRALGWGLHTVSLSPFVEAAKLLYQGPWVAERTLATHSILDAQPDALLPVIRTIVEGGKHLSAMDSFRAQYQLQAFIQQAAPTLEMVDAIASAKYRGNTWSAWSEVTPRHRALIDAMMQSSMHVIATLRSKTETAQQDVGGKKTVVKLGTKPEQREGIEYEMSIVLDLTHDGHFAIASKDRTGLLMGRDPFLITPDTGRMLLEWLESGEDAAPSQMQQSMLADHLAAIEAASTIDELRAVFEAAYKAAKDAGDEQAMVSLRKAKDARKAALTPSKKGD